MYCSCVNPGTISGYIYFTTYVYLYLCYLYFYYLCYLYFHYLFYLYFHYLCYLYFHYLCYPYFNYLCYLYFHYLCYLYFQPDTGYEFTPPIQCSWLDGSERVCVKYTLPYTGVYTANLTYNNTSVQNSQYTVICLTGKCKTNIQRHLALVITTQVYRTHSTLSSV